MSFKLFLEMHNFEFNHLIVSPSGGSLSLKEMDISPMEFLNLAENDFIIGGLSAQVNSVTNSKRAIVSQMDQILLTFGFPALKWNIPKKIEHLRKMGLLSPGVLRKISIARNLLEHEYIKPTNEEVEIALDVASLFVLGCKAMYSPFTNEFELYLDSSWSISEKKYLKYLTFEIVSKDDGTAFIVFRASEETASDQESHVDSTTQLLASFRHRKELGKYVLKNTDPLFCHIVKLANAYNIDYRVEEAIRELNEAYDLYQ